jgi:hypothetical protein
MTKFRSHRGTLADSMATVIEIGSRHDIAAIVAKDARLPISANEVQVKPYGYDSRIGWDTHIVTIPGWGVAGFTDGPV